MCLAALLMQKLELYEEATVLYWELLERNPENWAYYGFLEETTRPGKL